MSRASRTTSGFGAHTPTTREDISRRSTCQTTAGTRSVELSFALHFGEEGDDGSRSVDLSQTGLPTKFPEPCPYFLC